MTEQEMQQLIARGDAIDQGAQAHADAETAGMLDERGQIITPDPDAAAMEWVFIPQLAAMFAKTVYPETHEHYTDARCMDVARAFVPVAEKYGWTGNLVSAELGLGMALIGFAMPAMMAHRARKAARVENGEAAPDGSRK